MEPTLMQKIKDALGKVGYEVAERDGGGLIVTVDIQWITMHLTLRSSENSRLHASFEVEGYAKKDQVL